MRKFNSLTFATARESPQVSGLTKTDPELADDAAEALANLIAYACNQFNVGKNMSDVQTAILANDLLKTYWYWRFDEFTYVLGQAIRGKFGPVYDRIDAPTVNEWCEKYAADREGLLTLEAEQQAKAYKLAEINRAPADTTTPEGQALREQLAQLSDADLEKGWHYYCGLPEPLTPEQSLKLAVATQEVNERRRAYWLPVILAQFQATPGKTASEQEAEIKTEKRRIELALLTGNHEAAGLRGPAGGEKLDWYGNPATPLPAADSPASGPFLPACPRCLQRPEQCICEPLTPQPKL